MRESILRGFKHMYKYCKFPRLFITLYKLITKVFTFVKNDQAKCLRQAYLKFIRGL